MKKPFACSLILALALVAHGRASAADPRLSEAMAVCDNMGMYVEMAQRQAGMGMPIASATDVVVASMDKNLKLAADVKVATISLVREIYAYVYATPAGSKESVDQILAKNCGKYRGYNLPQADIEQHLALSAQSAWDPLVRVPLCVKLAQSAANIATGRDRGMSREKMGVAAAAGLRGDKFTSAQLPTLLAEAYDHPEAEVTYFYVFNLGRCKASAEGRSYPPASALIPEYAKCKAGAAPGQAAGTECLKQVFKVDPKA